MTIRIRLTSLVRRVLHLLAIAGVATLAACGGGGGDGGGTAASSVAPPPAPSTLAIAGFVPTAGGAGTTITVTGAGFTGLQSARIGSTAASFTVASDTQLALVVPAGAQTGRIELTAAGRTVLSVLDFTVSGVPQVTSLSPTSVLPGGRVTLSGSSLDRVAQVRVNSTVLPIASQTAGHPGGRRAAGRDQRNDHADRQRRHQPPAVAAADGRRADDVRRRSIRRPSSPDSR